MTTYYSIRSINPGRFLCAKFKDDVTFDLTSVYDIWREREQDPWQCNCPSGRRPCKHVAKILPKFQADAKIDSEEFLGEDMSWARPLAADFYAIGGVDAAIGMFAKPEDAEATEEIWNEIEELAQVIDDEEEALIAAQEAIEPIHGEQFAPSTEIRRRKL